jgi:hypothetical protein
VDTLCWDLFHSCMSTEEFAELTCSEMNLPSGYEERISLQMIEQIEAFREIVDCVYKYRQLIPNWTAKVTQIQPITIGIRQGSVDYSDKVDWDPMNEDFTPEEFAAITCADLGLPQEVEPAIAHKLRESLFRWLIGILQNPTVDDVQLKAEFSTQETKLLLVHGSQTVDMISNLWKRAKPNSMDEIAAVPQPQLPDDRDSNASIWTNVTWPSTTATTAAVSVPNMTSTATTNTTVDSEAMNVG